MGNLLASDLPSAVVVQVPLRAQFQFTPVDSEDARRHGFALFLEVAPGLSRRFTRGYRTAVVADPTPLPGTRSGALRLTYRWR